MVHRRPVDYIARTRALYDELGYAPYRWVVHDDEPPWTPLRTRLADCRVALLGSGGVYARGQIAFHFADDTSFRVIPSDIDLADLRVTHFAYDLTDARRDIGCVFPLAALRSLTAARVIGGLTPRAYGFMGGVYSARRIRHELAPALAEELARDRADLALLVPV